MSKQLGQVIKDYTKEEWLKLDAQQRKDLIKLGVTKFNTLNEPVTEPETPTEPEDDSEE